MKFYQFQSNIKLFQKVSSVTQQFKTLNLVNEVRDLNLFRKKTHHYLEKNFQVEFRICSKFNREKTVFCCFCKEKRCQKKSTDSMGKTKEQSLLSKKPEVSKWSRSLLGFFLVTPQQFKNFSQNAKKVNFGLTDRQTNQQINQHSD